MDIGPTTTWVVVLAVNTSIRLDIGSISTRRRKSLMDIGPTSTWAFACRPVFQSHFMFAFHLGRGVYTPTKVDVSQTDIHPTLTPSAGYQADVNPSMCVFGGISIRRWRRLLDIGPMSSRAIVLAVFWVWLPTSDRYQSDANDMGWISVWHRPALLCELGLSWSVNFMYAV